MTIKEGLHRLADQLPDEESRAAAELLERYARAMPARRVIGMQPAIRRETVYLDITASTYQSKGMRTTVTLDDDVYEAALHLSRVSGERLGKTLSTLVRRSLTSARPPVRGKSSRRFPSFDVPPGARIIPASRIERVIDEEGIF